MLARKIGLLFSLALVAGTLSAADNQTEKEKITRQAMQANKKAVVAHNMNLTPEQEKTFWPLYDEYQIEINKLNADREATIKKFAINFNSMSDELADELLEDEIGLEKKEVDVRKSLISSFRKKFPAKLVARYFQIENKIDNSIMAEATSQIPLMK
jgi:hypothetical protein